jgi:uncharacterized protein (TIGR02466 family)
MSANPYSISENHVWATSIYTAVNPQHVAQRAALKEHIYAIEKAPGPRVASGIAPQLKANLFESKFDFFQTDHATVQALHTWCSGAVTEVVRHRNSQVWDPSHQFQLQVVESWFHVTRAGGYHELHNHPNCSWCGIYYIEIGDSTGGDGSNVFLDPRAGAHNYLDAGASYLNQFTQIDFEPEDGKLIIFPSYLLHAAKPYSGAKDRIVVAFNCAVRKVD